MAKKPLTINSYGRKTRSKGKHSRISVKSEALTVDLDPAKLAAPVAEAIKEEIAAGIRGISEKGRSGRRLFNNTGHLASDLSISSAGAELHIAAPPDRLQAAGVLFSRLVELVPVLSDPRKLISATRVQKAQRQVLEKMHKKRRLR